MIVQHLIEKKIQWTGDSKSNVEFIQVWEIMWEVWKVKLIIDIIWIMRENVTLEQCNFSYDAILQDPKVRMKEANGEKLRQFVCSKYVVRQPIKAHSLLNHWIWELYRVKCESQTIRDGIRDHGKTMSFS